MDYADKLKEIENPTEHQEQVAFVQYFRRKYENVEIFAIPNGEKRSISVANRLKCEGVRKGVPDLFIPAWKLWIEFKRIKPKKASLSSEQKKWIKYLFDSDYHCFVAYGHFDAVDKLNEYIKICNL
jgi:hypothetical protein